MIPTITASQRTALEVIDARHRGEDITGKTSSIRTMTIRALESRGLIEGDGGTPVSWYVPTAEGKALLAPRVFYKAVRPNGKDFHTGTVDYGKAAKSKSKTITHPAARSGSTSADKYFSVATVATDCTGFSWPARLFEVEAIGEPWTPHAGNMPNKRAVSGMKILRELPAWQVFGPEGELIVAIITRFNALTDAERVALRTEYMKTYDTFWATESAVASDGRADRAGLGAARYAFDVQLVGWVGDCAACGAALAVLIRPHIGTGKDQFSQSEYDTLARAWRKIIGPIHPADKAVR